MEPEQLAGLGVQGSPPAVSGHTARAGWWDALRSPSPLRGAAVRAQRLYATAAAPWRGGPGPAAAAGLLLGVPGPLSRNSRRRRLNGGVKLVARRVVRAQGNKAQAKGRLDLLGMLCLALPADRGLPWGAGVWLPAPGQRCPVFAEEEEEGAKSPFVFVLMQHGGHSEHRAIGLYNG